MTPGLIINTRAGTYLRSKRVRNSLVELSRHTHTGFLDDFTTLPRTLSSLAQKNCDPLIISGGDGTIQAILTHLAEGNHFKSLPTLVLLPHGTTNMTAKDASISSLSKTDRLISAIATQNITNLPGGITRRHTLKITNPKSGTPLHGMYFGWGAVHRAVLKCQQDVHAMGFRGDLGPALTLLGSWVSHLLGRSGSDPDRIVQGHHLSLVADGETRVNDPHLLLSITTLEHLIANCRPFWNQTENTLKTTLIAYPVQQPLRMLIPSLYGDKHRKITQPGYDSFSARHLSFKTTTDCILDGEVVIPPDDDPLHLSLGTEFRFLKV